RQALATILEARGFRVLEAGDGREAVEIARRERPAAVLMDIAMPRTDGISALELLRRDERTASIPVAAVTARAMPDDRRRIEEAGFDALLVKPFRISQLLSLLERLLPSSSPSSSR
ncbi:MAG: response regulator, partial [Gemmatimonadota bacterium]